MKGSNRLIKQIFHQKGYKGNHSGPAEAAPEAPEAKGDQEVEEEVEEEAVEEIEEQAVQDLAELSILAQLLKAFGVELPAQAEAQQCTLTFTQGVNNPSKQTCPLMKSTPPHMQEN